MTHHITYHPIRNTHGFIQYKIDGRWQFNVTGFGDNAPDGSCVVSIQMYHGGTGDIPVSVNVSGGLYESLKNDAENGSEVAQALLKHMIED